MPKGKVAVITGASRGIGKSIALALAAQGATIVAMDMDQAATEAVVAELQAAGAKALAVVGNVTVTADVDRMIEAAVEAFGRVDILVNNAGITKDGFLLRMSDEDWDRVLNINLRGTFLFTRAAAKVMLKQRSGSIVNIASIIGLIGNPGQCNYSASKAGVIALTKTVARELGSRNIRANAVAPGFIRTRMTDVLPEETKKSMLGAIPLGRFGEPEDVARAVAFLASDDAAYVNGQVLNVCGGMVT